MKPYFLECILSPKLFVSLRLLVYQPRQSRAPITEPTFSAFTHFATKPSRRIQLRKAGKTKTKNSIITLRTPPLNFVPCFQKQKPQQKAGRAKKINSAIILGTTNCTNKLLIYSGRTLAYRFPRVARAGR